MTTQALLSLILAIGGAGAIAGMMRRQRTHRDPHDGMAVYSVGTARAALALVERLERTGPDDATALRHLTAVETWAGPERSHGSRRHREAAAELFTAAGRARVERNLPPGTPLTTAAAARGALHLRTGGRLSELGEVIACAETQRTIGGRA